MSARTKSRPTHRNEALAAAMRDLRSSSAASPHVPRPRKGTRGQSSRRAIREQRED